MSNYAERLDETTVRFERLLPGSVDLVWQYLTDAEKRSTWLCGGETELRPGGHVDMQFHNASLTKAGNSGRPAKYADTPDKISFTGTVVACDPPRRLTYSWNFEGTASEVTYELSEQDDTVLLALTHRKLSSREEVIDVCAGWHTHLDILADVLSDREPSPFWETHAALEAEYENRLL